MGSIVVGIDFSRVTDLLLQVASEQAKAFSDEVYLIHVAEPDPEFVGLDAGPPVVRDQLAADLHKGHAKLQQLSVELKKQGCNSTALLLQGAVAELLAEQGTRLDARLLIVGSHRHGHLRDALIGSTVRNLMRLTAIPVLVVPARN